MPPIFPPSICRLAHQLYNELLKPVEAGWKSAKDIILVTNGALGMLPLGVLPTEPPGPLADVSVPFDGYRKVAWLSRTHAVTMVPSATALRTLRGLKPGSPQRELMVGFGDPYFSAEQASKAGEPAAHQLASAASSSRGAPLARRNTPQTLGVDKAELGLLPRLPDTADELKSIALALQADPTKVLHLGKEANERNVKSIDLSKYKIVVFAATAWCRASSTGLHPAALAMTAPDVARPRGDGSSPWRKCWRSSSTPIGSCCRPATPEREPARAPRRLQGSAARSSTPERGRSWSPTGRYTRSRRANS